MLTKFLILLHNALKVKDSDRFFDRATNAIFLCANVIDVLVILFMAIYVGKLLIVLYAVIMAVLVRLDMGEHYDTWFECLVSGLMIYSAYAFTSIIVNNLIVDLILGLLLAVFMIDFKSEKARMIFKKSKP